MNTNGGRDYFAIADVEVGTNRGRNLRRYTKNQQGAAAAVAAAERYAY